MAIRKKVKDKRPHVPANTTSDVAVPVFSYPPSDGLAQVIVDAWANPGHLLDRDSKGNPTPVAVQEATTKVNAAGFDLKRAVVISEEEHDNDYYMQGDEEVVFVLPDKVRVKTPAAHLLETAKLLMACTPNGI